MQSFPSLISPSVSKCQFCFLRIAALLPRINAAQINVNMLYLHPCKPEEREVRGLKPDPERKQVFITKRVCCGRREVFLTLDTWRGKCFTHEVVKSHWHQYHNGPATPNLKWSTGFKTLQSLPACYHPCYSSTDSVKWLKLQGALPLISSAARSKGWTHTCGKYRKQMGIKAECKELQKATSMEVCEMIQIWN